VFRHLFDVALEDVHQRGLGLVVEIVARQEEVGLERFGVLREEVSPEDAAVGTGAMFSGRLRRRRPFGRRTPPRS